MHIVFTGLWTHEVHYSYFCNVPTFLYVHRGFGGFDNAYCNYTYLCVHASYMLVLDIVCLFTVRWWLNHKKVNSSFVPTSKLGRYFLDTKCLLLADKRLLRALLFLKTLNGVLAKGYRTYGHHKYPTI